MSQVNCPTCGANNNSNVANCEYCGVEVGKPAQLTPQEYVEALRKCVAKARQNLLSDAAEAEVVKAFPIPTDLNVLTEFFFYCHSNVQPGLMGIADNSTAWRAKARAAYGRLRLASLNNPQLLSYLEEFKETYSEAAMKASAKAWAYIIGGVVLVIAIIDILIILSERK